MNIPKRHTFQWELKWLLLIAVKYQITLELYAWAFAWKMKTVFNATYVKIGFIRNVLTYQMKNSSYWLTTLQLDVASSKGMH